MKQPCNTEWPDQQHQNRNIRHRRAIACITVAMLVVLLEGCASQPKDYWGIWRPINRYQKAPTPIPLNEQYTYYATPLDGTLRTMLRRWAKDSGMQFSYQLQSDYTLTQPVSAIRTTDVHRALADLNAIYATQGIQLYTLNNEIRAEPAPDPAGRRPTESASTDSAPPIDQAAEPAATATPAPANSPAPTSAASNKP